MLEPYLSKIVGESDIGSIGVDAGLAGFFENKKDYNDEEWEDFCNFLDQSTAQAWEIDNGFFAESGYGDGCYDVYAYVLSDGTAVGLKIVFIDDNEINDEIDDDEINEDY